MLTGEDQDLEREGHEVYAAHVQAWRSGRPPSKALAPSWPPNNAPAPKPNWCRRRTTTPYSSSGHCCSAPPSTAAAPPTKTHSWRGPVNCSNC